MNDTHPLDDLLEEMLPTAGELIVAVRDRDAEIVADVLAPLNIMQLRAVLIDVAVMVPANDIPFNDLLAWTHGPHVPSEDYADVIDSFQMYKKRCTRCERRLLLEKFAKDSAQQDGRKPRCRGCTAEVRFERLRDEQAVA